MSNLIYTSTAEMTPEQWLGFRKCGIGASEVGALMGLSQYKSNIELFYDKIGQGLGFNVENIAMFMGTELEDFIAKMWQYWGGSEASLIDNFRKGTKVRKMQKVNAYIQNPKFPWLFVSLDRKREITLIETHIGNLVLMYVGKVGCLIDWRKIK